MESLSFERLVNEVDDAMKTIEAQLSLRKEVEGLERERRHLAGQADALAPRIEKLAPLGAPELVAKARLALDAIQQRIGEVDQRLAALRPKLPAPTRPSPAAVPPLPTADVQAKLDALGEEIDREGPSLAAPTAPERRIAQLRVWALAWRVLVSSPAGQAMGKAINPSYAKLREAMNPHSDLPYMDALSSAAQRNWEDDLAKARHDLATIDERERRRSQSDAAFDALKAVTAKYHLPEDAAGMKELRHAIRGCLGYRTCRAELAEFCAPWREQLPEFGYLWRTDDEEAPPEAEPKSRREILEGMLSRMYRKKEIGGKHTSFNNVYRGVCGAHDVGAAREVGELLIKVGILIRKVNNGDLHVSLDPTRVRDVETFLDGGSLGVETVERWMSG